MPEFDKAVVLLAVTAALVEVLKILVGPKLRANDRALIGVCLVASFASVFVLRYSLWAHEQVIQDKPLDEIRTSHLVTLAVMLWLVEVGAFILGKKIGVGAARAVGNIGIPLEGPAPVTAVAVAGDTAEVQVPAPLSIPVSDEVLEAVGGTLPGPTPQGTEL